MGRNDFDPAGSRILVTGGGGLIGRPTVRALVARGSLVTVLERPGVEHEPLVDWIEGSITDEPLVRRLVAQSDVVVHLAGIPGLDHGNAGEIYESNALGTFLVLNAAGEARLTKAVYASSINASGIPLNPRDALPSRFPYGEDEPEQIADWYSLSKKANEDAAAMVAERWGIAVTGLRFPLVRDITLDGGAVFARHIRAGLAADPRRAACEGWSYLDSSDAALAIVAALTHDTPAAPGILVAAPLTYLSTPTETALDRFAPSVPHGTIEGRSTALDLHRSHELLEFEARLLLEQVDPLALISLEGAADVD